MSCMFFISIDSSLISFCNMLPGGGLLCNSFRSSPQSRGSSSPSRMACHHNGHEGHVDDDDDDDDDA